MSGTRPMNRWWILPIVLLLLLGVAACGSGEEGLWSGTDEAEFARAPAQPAAAMVTDQAMSDAPVMKEVLESQAPAAPGLPGRPGNVPAAPAAAAKVVLESDAAASSEQQLAQLVVQQRIIIRTVDMGVEVDDVGAAIDDIGDLAKRMGGWVVSSDRPLRHTGSVSIRVPAEMLDQAILDIRRSWTSGPSRSGCSTRAPTAGT